MGTVVTRPQLPVVQPMFKLGCTGEFGCGCPEKRREDATGHGTVLKYNRGCRCTPCKASVSERNRRYQRKKRAKK